MGYINRTYIRVKLKPHNGYFMEGKIYDDDDDDDIRFIVN